MKLGSLFDGSGTAPLAATMCGITPAWASEIEPYPIAVTKARFPDMKHLGSILDINGAEIEPVDIICGGSPCQDLSVAGQQKGLIEGERSNLFFEMIRVIKEMREATNGQFPRWIIWENVPGAFSSNKGRDFLEVIRQFSALADPNIYVPEPPSKNGKLTWRYAGSIVGTGWSLSWRTMDAQYWGVPQRRRRVYLVLDFRSERSGEILFERNSVCGNTAESRETGQGAPADAEGSAGGSCITFKERAGKPGGGKGILCDTDLAFTQATSADQNVCYSLEEHTVDRESTQNGRGWSDEHFHTLNATDRNAVVYDKTIEYMGHDERSSQGLIDGKCDTLTANDYKQPGILAYGVDAYNQSLLSETSIPLRSAASDVDHAGGGGVVSEQSKGASSR